MASNPPKYTRSQFGNPEIVKSNEPENEERENSFSPAYAFKQAVAIHNALKHLVEYGQYFDEEQPITRSHHVAVAKKQKDKIHLKELTDCNALEKFETLVSDPMFMVMFMKRTI